MTLEGIDDWSEAIAKVSRGDFRRVLVIGPVDAGKTTFCNMLLTGWAKHGHPAALIDADVGQKSVGPPAAVTAAEASAPDHPTDLVFVGTMDPLSRFSRVVEGLRRITERKADRRLVANTSGLLRGAGQALKAAKISAFRPDLVLALGTDPALEGILARHSGECLRLAPSPLARRKTRGERRAIRHAAFRRHFAGAVVHRLGPEVLPALATPMPERLLVGLADARERDMALGVLLGPDAETGGASVLAPPVASPVARLLPGLLLLDEQFQAVPLARDLHFPL